MNINQTLFLISLLISLSFCKGIKEAIEFEENKIESDAQKFTFKTSNISTLIIIAKNENFNYNSYDETNLTLFNSLNKKLKEYSLEAVNYIVLDDIQNKEDVEYILKFKNYQGGYFIIFNSANIYPLKQIEKGFSLFYKDVSKKEVNLTFTTEILDEDIFLDIYPGENFKIKNISNIASNDVLPIENNFIELNKGYNYSIEFCMKDNLIKMSIKKREIINYTKNKELKFNLFNQVPYFILINIKDFDTDIIYSYLYSMPSIYYNIEIAEVESEIIGNWTQIEFINKRRINRENAYKINVKETNTNFTLIKITIDTISYNTEPFYIFKIFTNYETEFVPVDSVNEALIIHFWQNEMIFIISNITNLKSFEKRKAESFIYQKESMFFPFVILPKSESYVLTGMRAFNTIPGKFFFKEKSFNNYLHFLFDSASDNKIWYFDIDQKTTFYIKSFFGFPKIYYADEINKETIQDFLTQKFEKFKEYNISNEVINFDAPFVLYIEPYEFSYLNFILNYDDNLFIMDGASNKYLIGNKEYVLSAPSKLMARIDEKSNSEIFIYKDEQLLLKLNKENPYIIINELEDLIFKSEKNITINLYYNITDIFSDESMMIIEFPIEKKDEIMVVEILPQKSKSYYYAMNYGYDYYISSDTKKIYSSQIYFFIEDPYSKIEEKNEELRHYLILFGSDIKYNINFIKQYPKENQNFDSIYYYKIKSDENYAIVSDNNFLNGYSTYEILLCENENINITMKDINNKTVKLTADSLLLNEIDTRALLTFESKKEFIFLQKEYYGAQLEEFEFKYYISKIENGKISILLLNELFSSESNTKYTFILVKDNNKDDNLKNQINNECYLFSLINEKITDISYNIEYETIDKEIFLYKELDYSNFIDSKYLLIKILSCENKKKLCVFSKTQRIFLENLKNEKEEEFGIKKIEEFTEYKITRQDYIFSYDYKNYLNKLEDIYIHIAIPTTSLFDYVGEFEVINPLLQSFTFRYRYTEAIRLIKNQHVVSNGRYYFIFRNCTGLIFYLHNPMKFFPLNKINNYISETSERITNGDNLLLFEMTLEEDKYIFLHWNGGNIYLYSINDKKSEMKEFISHHAYKIKKGSYIIIFYYDNKEHDSFSLSINTNRYLVELETSKEINSVMGTNYILQPTISAVVDLSKYENNQLYVALDSTYFRSISCEKSLDIDSIVQSTVFGNKLLTSHIIPISERSRRCNPPYYNIKLFTAAFELVSEIYEITTSQNFLFKQNETVAFTVKGNGYNLVLSNKENLKWLDKMENDFVNVLISNEQIQFKVKNNDEEETNLRIRIFDNENNIIINNLTNKEISEKIIYNNENNEIKYYINLSKNKYVINHFNYIGKLEFYISKEEINENNIEEILKNDKSINLDFFYKVMEDKFDLGKNKILAIKKENIINSELLMTPLIHEFIIDNMNSKFLIANKKYFIKSYIKIILEDNSDAKIIIYDLNNNEIFSLDKNNYEFENINYNKSLFMKSDKDSLIYIYHPVKEKLKYFKHPKNLDSVLILNSSDCDNNKLTYFSEFGFSNYLPLNSNINLKNLSNSTNIIYFLNNDEIKTQNGVNYFTFIKCESDFTGNSSELFEKFTSNEGSKIIEKNKNVYIHTVLDTDNKNIFYQIFQCEQNNTLDYEFFTSIDGNEFEQLEKNTSFINGENNITFFLKTNDELFFNYYKTKSNIADYETIIKNESPHFNISYLSKNKIKIDLIPFYKEVDFDFYFVMYLDKENKTRDNPFKNKCYIKELINSDKVFINMENTYIKKIEYKNGEIINNTFDIPDLEVGEVIHSNILGLGYIFEDCNEYLFYNEQSHIIEISDLPSDSSPKTDPEPEKSHSLNVGAIIGIVVGGIVLILIGIFLVLRCRRKNSIDLENDNTNYPLIMENKN